MAGMAGIAGAGADRHVQTLDAMVDALAVHPPKRIERRADASLAAAVLSHGPDADAVKIARSDDGTRTLLLFGECFGYEDERRRLENAGCRFAHAASDAEFCLRLYEHEGNEEAFARLSGSFCIALHDATSGVTSLVSDRLATRPLFYAPLADGRLVFATQLSAVLRCPEVPRDPDVGAMLEFCALQRVLGDKTHIAAVRLVPPGTVLRFDGTRVQSSPYWRLVYAPRPGSADEYAEELAQVMRQSARHLFRGGARVAMLLSGGLDARMVVAAAEQPLHCFTFADYDNPEVAAARTIAAARGCEFTFLPRSPDHYVDLLDRAVEIGGGMYTFNHAHAIGFVETIATQCDVVTHGYAPELMFRGPSLPRVPRQLMGLDVGDVPDPALTATTLKQRILRRGYSLLAQGVRGLLTPDAARRLDQTLEATAEHLVSLSAGQSENVYDRFLCPDVHYQARYPSMLFEISLRSLMCERSLFFDNAVIDLHLRMPQPLRSDNTVWLKALARLDRTVANAVNANTGHSAQMPPALAATLDAASARAGRLPLVWRLSAARRKSSGTVSAPGHSPISWPRFDWMVRNHPKLRQRIEQTLGDPQALPPELFDHVRLRALLDDHLAGKVNQRSLLFALVTIARWNQQTGLHGRVAEATSEER